MVLVAATLVGLLTFTQFLPGGRRSFSDWIEPLLFLVTVSLCAATACVGLCAFGRWFCRWRRLKRVLLAGACLAALVALFYAEEDWRGWHAWNQFKHELEAKGEHFSLPSAVPPTVPDQQNFALTPIVFTSYGQILTRDGKLIPPEKRDDHFLVRMRMPLTLDYPGPTNCSGNRVQGTFTRLDCWQSYYRTQAGRSNALPVGAQARAPAADVLLALSQYDQVIEELRAASCLPCSRYPINYDSESPFMIHLPHLAPLKNCAQVLQLRTLAELQIGRPDKALADVLLALQLTDKVRTEPFLISHLVRIAMLQLTLQPIWEGLAGRTWSDPQLAALDSELQKLNFASDWTRTMSGELGAQSDEMELLRRHPERFQELQALIDFAGSKSDVKLPLELVVRVMPANWFYQNQHRCARMMVNYCLPMADANRNIFSPALARRAEAAMASEPTAFSRFGRLILPVLRDAAPKFAYAQGSVDLARTAIALERCRLARGQFPASLEGLAPQFIAQIPHDVIGGQPLKYRLEPDGLFVLYSAGWNEKDDGGQAAFKPDGTVDLENGDWVWRYPSKAP